MGFVVDIFCLYPKICRSMSCRLSSKPLNGISVGGLKYFLQGVHGCPLSTEHF